MRHNKGNRKIGLRSSARIAMLKNMTSSLILSDNGIVTTVAKARELRPFAEKLLTIAKKCSNDLSKQRTVRLNVPIELAYRKLMDTIVPIIADRNGGYLRIIKIGYRARDAAHVAKIQFVDA